MICPFESNAEIKNIIYLFNKAFSLDKLIVEDREYMKLRWFVEGV